MFTPLRSLLFLFSVVIFLVADSLYAQGPPPLPAPPRPNNPTLDGLGDRFSSPGTISRRSVPAAEQDVHFPENLPSPNPVSQTAFATHPISSLAALEEPNREALPENTYHDVDDEYSSIHHAVLEKSLSSRRQMEYGDEADDAGPGGWKNTLAMPNFTPIISVGSTLLIVIAAFFILAIFLRKVSPQSARALPKEAFECLGRYYLTQKHQVQLLRIGSRIVLVSVMPDGVSTLAEITDPDEAVSLLGSCRRLDTNSATEVFRKTVASMSDDELNRSHHRPVVAPRQVRQPAAALDLYSEPDESLAAILARGRQYGR